jgi:predicted RNA-binding Zn-ribbon protein involved in translation (DUF1610 family)
MPRDYKPTSRYQPSLAPDPEPTAPAESTPILVGESDEPVILSATEAVVIEVSAVPVEDDAVEHPCPHCGAEMVKHPDGGLKDGAWHCDACGGCWVHRGSAWFLREGHPPPDGWEGG